MGFRSRPAHWVKPPDDRVPAIICEKLFATALLYPRARGCGTADAAFGWTRAPRLGARFRGKEQVP